MIALAAMLLAVLPADARKKPQKFTHETYPLPAVTPQVIAVETAGTQLLLQVDAKGTVRTVRYGAPAGAPEEYAGYTAGTYHNWGAPDTYPAVGARFNGGIILTDSVALIIIIDRVKIYIGHTDFFTLVNKGATGHCMGKGCEKLGRLNAVLFIIAKTGNLTRCIVI